MLCLAGIGIMPLLVRMEGGNPYLGFAASALGDTECRFHPSQTPLMRFRDGKLGIEKAVSCVRFDILVHRQYLR
jgi:hypothetical protein